VSISHVKSHVKVTAAAAAADDDDDDDNNDDDLCLIDL
jgi:hypothetical protein